MVLLVYLANHSLLLRIILTIYEKGDKMSRVNADTTQLLTILRTMQSSIASMETAKNSMKLKYQQLGTCWNDKRYNELGVIVNDCNKALSDVSQIMRQAEKYISALAKSIQAYDNVNLGATSDRNSFIQSLGIFNTENSSYQYCLGVLTKGSIPDGYNNIIAERHNNAEQKAKEVFDHFADRLMIWDSIYPADQTAHYSPANYVGHLRGVYYNAASDMTNPRGAGTTYFHELAHMIDHASTEYQGNLSNNPDFRQALLEDGQNALNRFNNAGEEGQRTFRNNLRQNNRTHSFQDLLEGSTNGNLSFYWGHNRLGCNYWARQGNLEAEAFAHFFEAAMGAPDKLELLTLWFPRATTVFFNMLDSIIGNQQYLTRSRL